MIKLKALTYLSIFSMYCGTMFFGQQTTQYTQYVYNYFAFNPALAGSQDCFNFKIGARQQWLGLEGKPETAFASFQTRLKFNKTRINRTNHGIGAYIESDVVGYYSKTTLNLAYAYHFPVARDVTASVGVFAGLQQFKLDASKIVANNYNDPLLGASKSAFLLPYITPGIFLKHDDWFAGLAIRQIVRNKWQKVIGDQARNRFHWSVVGGKRFKLGEFNVVPSAMIKWAKTTNPALDLNVLLEISKQFEVGLSWRNQDAIAAMAKVKFARYFTLGYAFDFTTSKLRVGSANTHELIIGISACDHNRNSTYICPVFE